MAVSLVLYCIILLDIWDQRYEKALKALFATKQKWS